MVLYIYTRNPVGDGACQRPANTQFNVGTGALDVPQGRTNKVRPYNVFASPVQGEVAHECVTEGLSTYTPSDEQSSPLRIHVGDGACQRPALFNPCEAHITSSLLPITYYFIHIQEHHHGKYNLLQKRQHKDRLYAESYKTKYRKWEKTACLRP